MSDLTDEEALAWVASITHTFAASLAQSLAGCPDLVEGFLAGRYVFQVTAEEFVVAEAPREPVVP